MILPINYQDTYLIRQEVLRKGKPIETCYFTGDAAKSTAHFGFFHAEQLIGVVSVFNTPSPLFHAPLQFQIRGMAVLNEFQYNGIGNELMLQAENYCRQQKGAVIWFNAREKAVRFYEKNDYRILGDAFEIPDVGIHFVMYKKLMEF
jgi:ribosomal protein S18 acetylase RimI-like enzyme